MVTDVKSQIANMVRAYGRYVKGKTTSQGISDARKAIKANEAKRGTRRAT